VGKLVIGVVGLIGFPLLYSYRIESRRVPRITETFEKGHEIPLKSDLVERPLKSLKKLNLSLMVLLQTKFFTS